MSMNIVDEQLEMLKRVREEIPELIYLGDPILRLKAQEVDQSEGVSIANRLVDVLSRYRELTGVGRGFAAPQIGECKAVFVLYLEDFEVFINPKILESSPQSNYYRELCLSSGVLWADVKRPEWVKLEWTTIEGELISRRFEGIQARIVQHEFDHLQGIVNLDRAEPGSIEFVGESVWDQKLRLAN